MGNAIITAVAAFFTFTCKTTGKEKRGKRVHVTLSFQASPVTNTGKWKVTTWQGSGKYLIHEEKGHWDSSKPYPHQPVMVSTGEWQQVDRRQGAVEILKWFTLFTKDEAKAWGLFSQLESAQVLKRDQPVATRATSVPVKPIEHAWGSTNELCRI